MKICTKCKRELANSCYNDNRSRSGDKDGKEYWCKDCKREYGTLYKRARMQDPEFRKKRASQAREYSIWYYGIDSGDLEEISKAQGGKCAGCGYVALPGKRLNIDHEHQSRDKQREPWERSWKVRGLLCHRCNRAIGLTKDNSEILRNLANYLDHPPARPILAKIWRKITEYLKKYEPKR